MGLALVYGSPPRREESEPSPGGRLPTLRFSSCRQEQSFHYHQVHLICPQAIRCWMLGFGSCATPLGTSRRKPCISYRYFWNDQWPKIGYTRSTDNRYREPLEHTVPQRLRTTSHGSKPHRIRTQPHVHRVHPIMAEQVLEMYPTRIQATRLWPDYSTTSPHAHTHAQRAQTRATSRGGALFVLSSRSSFLWTMKSQLAPPHTRHRSASMQTFKA